MAGSGNLPRDDNHIAAIGGVDSSTGKLVPLNIDHATGNLLTSAAAASSTSTSINDGVTASRKATVASLTDSNPLAVEIVDGNGDQIISFGGGTQYVDAAATATHPTGTMPVYDNAGTISKVSVGNGLPIQPATGSSFAVTGTFWQSTQPISATSLPLPSGASTAAKQPALGVAGTASSDVITIQGIASMTKLLVTPDSVALPANQSVNISQINSVTPLMGNGVTGTGSQRVTIASDNTAFGVNATLSAETTKVIGTVNIASSQSVGISAGTAVIGHVITDSGTITTVSNLSQIASTTPTFTSQALDVNVKSETAPAVTLIRVAIAASSSGDNTLIAAVSAKKIYVVAFELSFSGTVNAKFTDGAAGTNLGGLYYGVANAGAANSISPDMKLSTPSPYLFVGSTNTALILNLSGATAVGGALTYFTV